MARTIAPTPLDDFPGHPLDAEFDELLKQDPLPFKKAMEPIAQLSIMHKCMERAEKTYEQAVAFKRKDGCALTIDGLAAIMKYCAEDAKPTFYGLMNSSCFDKDRSKVRPFVPFMWLLIKTLWQLEPYAGREVYRGVKVNLREEYKRRKEEGKQVTFWGFTSTTKREEVLKQDMFLGQTDPRTLFIIQLTQSQARDISAYSPLPEGEVLLPPCSTFEVGAVIDQDPLVIITLVEVYSTQWIVNMGPKEEELQQKAQRLQKEMEVGRDKANRLEAERDALWAQITKLDRDAEARSARHQELELEVKRLDKERKTLQDRIGKLEQEAKERAQQLEKAKKETDEQARRSAEKEKALRDEVVSVKAENKALQDKVQNFERKAQTHSSDRQSSKPAVEELGEEYVVTGAGKDLVNGHYRRCARPPECKSLGEGTCFFANHRGAVLANDRPFGWRAIHGVTGWRLHYDGYICYYTEEASPESGGWRSNLLGRRAALTVSRSS